MTDEEYLGDKHNYNFIDENGYKYYSLIQNIKTGSKPRIASIHNPYSIENIKLLCKLNSKTFELKSDVFNGVNDKLEWKCLKENCGGKFESDWHIIFTNGSGCPYCTGHKVNINNCLATLYPEIAKEWHPTKNGKLTHYDVPKATPKKVWWQCRINQKHEWKAKIQNRTLNNNACPYCSESKGEKRIREWLEENNIVFEPQKQFNKLLGTGGGNLSYDFYLPKQNILIEYQGEFHDGSSGDYSRINLKTQKEHDKRKCEYAKYNNINLMDIWYWDFENIEKILISKLIK